MVAGMLRFTGGQRKLPISKDKYSMLEVILNIWLKALHASSELVSIADYKQMYVTGWYLMWSLRISWCLS